MRLGFPVTALKGPIKPIILRILSVPAGSVSSINCYGSRRNSHPAHFKRMDVLQKSWNTSSVWAAFCFGWICMQSITRLFNWSWKTALQCQALNGSSVKEDEPIKPWEHMRTLIGFHRIGPIHKHFLTGFDLLGLCSQVAMNTTSTALERRSGGNSSRRISRL